MHKVDKGPSTAVVSLSVFLRRLGKSLAFILTTGRRAFLVWDPSCTGLSSSAFHLEFFAVTPQLLSHRHSDFRKVLLFCFLNEERPPWDTKLHFNDRENKMPLNYGGWMAGKAFCFVVLFPVSPLKASCELIPLSVCSTLLQKQKSAVRNLLIFPQIHNALYILTLKHLPDLCT